MINKLFKKGNIFENLAMIFVGVFVSVMFGFMFGGLIALENIEIGIIVGVIGFIIMFIVVSLALSKEKEFNLKTYLSLLGLIILGVPTIVFFFIHLFSLIPTWGSALIVLILFIFLTEILFGLDKDKPKNKKNIMAFTFKKKGEAATEAGILTILAGTTGYVLREYNLFEKIKQFLIAAWDSIKYFFIALWEWLKAVIPELLKFIGVSLLVIAGIAVLIFLVYLYIKLNSLKYKNAFKKTKAKKKKVKKK